MLDHVNYGEVAIRSDCGNNYTSHVSQILIHPPNQPYGIVLDLSLKTCDNGTSCVNTSDHPGLCFHSFIPYEAVCTNYELHWQNSVWKLCYRW